MRLGCKKKKRKEKRELTGCSAYISSCFAATNTSSDPHFRDVLSVSGWTCGGCQICPPQPGLTAWTSLSCCMKARTRSLQGKTLGEKTPSVSQQLSVNSSTVVFLQGINLSQSFAASFTGGLDVIRTFSRYDAISADLASQHSVCELGHPLKTQLISYLVGWNSGYLHWSNEGKYPEFHLSPSCLYHVWEIVLI